MDKQRKSPPWEFDCGKNCLAYLLDGFQNGNVKNSAVLRIVRRIPHGSCLESSIGIDTVCACAHYFHFQMKTNGDGWDGGGGYTEIEREMREW